MAQTRAEKTAYHKQWRDNNRQHIRAYARELARKRRQKPEQRVKDHAWARNGKRRKELTAMGVDDAAIQTRYAEQGGRCGVCEKPILLDLGSNDRRGRAHAHIDHDHATGRFRGLLCSRCNTGLGHLGDNEAGLLKALAYLKGV